MSIWSSEIKELEKLYESFKGQLPDLEKELERLVKANDENMILLYSRRCLEVMVTDLCECELKRPRKTEPLKGIIDKLHKEEKVPSNIITSMDHLNGLSAYGAHPKDFDPEQVKPVLNNLSTIIKWYFKYKESRANVNAKPAEEARQEIKSTDNVKKAITISRKRLAGILGGSIGIIAAVFAVLYFSNIIGHGKRQSELDKSIAVLPFKLLSDEPEKQYLADGMMDAILLHLSKIKDLRVMSRTSVEQYRKTDKTLNVIGKELDVAYLLEGSFQKFGDNARLIVQLIKTGKEDHVWANNYDRIWSDVFQVQSEVAQKIADELHAAITPGEKQLIEKIPTKNLAAYDLYQRGREEQLKYWLNNSKTESLEKAEKLFHRTIKLDSTFAQAYVGLAMIYWDKHYWETIMSEDFLDSVLILSNAALSYNNQLSDAYMVRGNYYGAYNKPEKAKEEYDKAINLNPNDFQAYYALGNITFESDFIKSLEYYQKAASLERGELLPKILRSIGWVLAQAGFPEKAKIYLNEAFNIDQDSLLLNSYMSRIDDVLGNYSKAYEYYKKRYSLDSTNTAVLWRLGYYSMFQHQHEKALRYFKKYIEKQNNRGTKVILFGLHRFAWAYGQNEYQKEAEFYLNAQIKNSQQVNNLDRDLEYGRRSDYDLAAAYAFKGEKETALSYLRTYSQVPQILLGMLNMIKDDPLFDNIRNETEFQAIVRDLEAKYQAAHERVKKWLEEQETL